MNYSKQYLAELATNNKLVFLPLHELQPYYWNLEHK